MWVAARLTGGAGRRVSQRFGIHPPGVQFGGLPISCTARFATVPTRRPQSTITSMSRLDAGGTVPPRIIGSGYRSQVAQAAGTAAHRTPHGRRHRRRNAPNSLARSARTGRYPAFPAGFDRVHVNADPRTQVIAHQSVGQRQVVTAW